MLTMVESNEPLIIQVLFRLRRSRRITIQQVTTTTSVRQKSNDNSSGSMSSKVLPRTTRTLNKMEEES